MTKRRDIIRLLELAGFTCVHGGNHDKYIHPDGRCVIVLRHKEINVLTTKSILKQIGKQG